MSAETTYIAIAFEGSAPGEVDVLYPIVRETSGATCGTLTGSGPLQEITPVEELLLSWERRQVTLLHPEVPVRPGDLLLYASSDLLAALRGAGHQPWEWGPTAVTGTRPARPIDNRGAAAALAIEVGVAPKDAALAARRRWADVLRSKAMKDYEQYLKAAARGESALADETLACMESAAVMAAACTGAFSSYNEYLLLGLAQSRRMDMVGLDKTYFLAIEPLFAISRPDFLIAVERMAELVQRRCRDETATSEFAGLIKKIAPKLRNGLPDDDILATLRVLFADCKNNEAVSLIELFLKEVPLGHLGVALDLLRAVGFQTALLLHPHEEYLEVQSTASHHRQPLGRIFPNRLSLERWRALLVIDEEKNLRQSPLDLLNRMFSQGKVAKA